ncbi:YDG domain-containing protein, partial [Flavobacterium sp.]|uniref:YDG domain-containing protein n=1 Tax=Flavobacterium sp. TaxID=239 RepID=UPI00262C6272
MKLILQWIVNLKVILSVIFLMTCSVSFSQTAYNMSSGDKTWALTGAWTVSGGTYTGTDASNWASVGITGTGNSVTTGVRTTKSSATIVTGTAGGFQKPSGSIQFLSTGATATPEAVAIDLLLNFTGRNAGTLSFDWAAIDNSGTRPTSLRVFWSIDGSTFTEISAAQLLDKESATSPSSGSISSIALPTAFNNSATARLRFYNHAGSTTIGSNTRDKFQIDNISITSTPAPLISASGTVSSLSHEYGSASPITNFSVSGNNMNAGITVTPPANFEVSTTSDFSASIGTNSSPLVVGASGTIGSTSVYLRLISPISVGNYNGTITLSSTGAQNVTVATNSNNTVSQKNVTISGLIANNKTFDNNTSASLSGSPVLNGIIPSDNSNVILSGTPVANFNDSSVGTNKPVTVTGYTLSGTNATNYLLAQPSGLTADIISSGLLDQTITFNPLASVTYGDASFNLTATSDSNLTISYTSSNTNVATIINDVVTIVGAGTTVITANQSGDSNYNPATPVQQNLVVTQKNLTISGATVSNKVYDATTTATIIGGNLDGIIGTDNVTFSGNGNFNTPSVGNNKLVTTALVLNGLSSANYALIQPTLTADILQKDITISGIIVNNKEYDLTTTASISGTPTLVGIIASDNGNVSLNNIPVANFATAAVENGKVVTVSGYSLSGSASANYNLLQPTGLTANITTKSLTIVGLTANNKEYDRTTLATLSGVAALNGLIPGDEANVVLDGSAVANFLTYTAGNAKSVSVTGYSISGSSIGNYNLQPLSLLANITKKNVTVLNPVATDKVYDGNNVATINGTIDGVISPDVVTLNLSGTFNNSNVGTSKPVTSTSTITGLDASNYNLIQPLGLLASIIPSPCTATTGNVNWNFTTASPSTNTVSNLTVSNLSQGNNNGITTLLTSTSASTGYLGSSGTSNAGAATRTGALDMAISAYFEFTVTPQSGYIATLNSIAFGSRSTGTGPASYSLRSSLDNYATTIATGSLSTSSIWALYSSSVTGINSLNGSPITFRLYGHNGTGSPSANTANWRIDDLNLNITNTPSAALSSPLTATICASDAFSYVPTTNYSGATITWTRPAVSGISNAAITSPQSTNPNETLVNTTTAPINVTYIFTVTTNTCFVSQNVVVTVNPILAWYLDADLDGYYSDGPVYQCYSPGLGYVTSVIGSGDCNDNVASINPGAVDVCYDGIDNDCNGIIDNVGLPGGCTPIVSTLPAAQCGTTVSGLSTSMYATNISGAQGYRFKV